MRSVFFCERWGLSIATIMLICCGIQPGLISSAPTAPTGTLVRRMVGVGDASKLEPLTPFKNLNEVQAQEEAQKIVTIDEHLNKLPAEEQVPFRSWLDQKAKENQVSISEDAVYHQDDFEKHLKAWRTAKEETRRAALFETEVPSTSYLHEWNLMFPDFVDRYLPPDAGFREQFKNTLPPDFKTPQIKTGAEFLKKYQSYAKEFTKDNRQMSIHSFVEHYLPQQPNLRGAVHQNLMISFRKHPAEFYSETAFPVSDLMSAYLKWVATYDVQSFGVPETEHFVGRIIVRASRGSDNPRSYQRYYAPTPNLMKSDWTFESIPERLFSAGLGDPKLQHAFYRTLPKIAAKWEKRQTELTLGEVHVAFRQFEAERRKANAFKKVYYKLIDLMHRFKDGWKKMTFYQKLSTSLDGLTLGAVTAIVL